MENKINIAEILRNTPKGTKLYSPLFGECNLDEVCTSDRKTYPIILLTSADTLVGFTKNGHYVDGFEDAECMLFPSDRMRDWDKFFKRGDIVYNPHSQMYAVFECWASDDYDSLTQQSTITPTTVLLARGKFATQSVSRRRTTHKRRCSSQQQRSVTAVGITLKRCK